MKSHRKLISIRSQAAHFQDREDIYEDIYLCILGIVIFGEILAQCLIRL